MRFDSKNGGAWLKKRANEGIIRFPALGIMRILKNYQPPAGTHIMYEKVENS
jgi:hypothetical protein